MNNTMISFTCWLKVAWLSVVVAAGASATESVQSSATTVSADPWRIDGVCDSSNCTYEELWDGLGCNELVKIKHNTHFFNNSVWMLLRGTYQGTVGPAMSSLVDDEDLHMPTESGFKVKQYMAHQPGGVRSVFAGQDIPKNAHVWDGTVQGAQFPTTKLFRHFVLSLPESLSCQMLLRCYPQTNKDWREDDDDNEAEENPKEEDTIEAEDVHMICDFDEGAFFTVDDSVDGSYNLGCTEELLKKHNLNGGCNRHLFAMDVIFAGETFLIDPHQHIYFDGFEKIGLGTIPEEKDGTEVDGENKVSDAEQDAPGDEL